MTDVAERLNALTTAASSPDKNIRATLKGKNNITAEFRPGAYERYRAHDLENQLCQLATLIWTGYRREYEKIITEAGLQVVIDPEDEWNSRAREYQRIRRQTEGIGKSGGGNVRAKTQALLRWQLRIGEGALSRLSEKEFLAEALDAISAAIKDYRKNSSRLRGQYFGTGDGYFV